jgi:hypothetical protein
MTAAADLAVDIVVNNHNYARYLPEAIESALEQTHERVRVIVVDDGSEDGSRELLGGYEDRVELVLKENGGQASALNAGMERCEGEVVVFLDSDDVLRPEAAARAAAAFAADNALAKAQFRMEIIDAEGRPTGAVKPAAHLPMPSGDLTQAELAYPYDLVWMSTSANAFRAERLRRIFPIPERDFRICADWYLVHLATLLGRVISLEEIGGAYRMHGANRYEPQSPELDLEHIRETIGFARATSRELLGLADELGLTRPERILSLSDLANRIISLRLDPGRHPIAGDRSGGLFLDAIRATRRRSNVSVAMKPMFAAWFGAMAIAPRPLARRLAIGFLFPERRASLNRLLGRLQRPGARAPGVA